MLRNLRDVAIHPRRQLQQTFPRPLSLPLTPARSRHCCCIVQSLTSRTPSHTPFQLIPSRAQFSTCAPRFKDAASEKSGRARYVGTAEGERPGKKKVFYRSLERQDGVVPLEPRPRKKGLFPLRHVEGNKKRELQRRKRQTLKDEHEIIAEAEARRLRESVGVEQEEVVGGEEEEGVEQEGEQEKGAAKKRKPRRKPADFDELVQEAQQKMSDKERWRKLRRKADDTGEEIDLSELQRDNLGPALKNLESLSAVYPPKTMLSNEKWMTLRQTLTDGFTIDQLEEYVRLHESRGTASAGKDEWTPALTLILDTRKRGSRFPLDHPGLSKYMAGKVGLAERIVRLCWGLSRETDMGRLEFRLSDEQIVVLLSPSKSPLKRYADLYDVKVEVQGSKGILKLTGAKGGCEMAHDAIQEYVEEIRKFNVPVKDLRFADIGGGMGKKKAVMIEEEFIDMLERAHSVIVDTETHDRKRHLSILSGDEKDFHDASRTVQLALLAQADPLYDPSLATYYTDKLLFEPVDVSSNLNWLNKHTSWLRWVSPAAYEAIPGGRSARRPPPATSGSEFTRSIAEELFQDLEDIPDDLLASPHVREVVDAKVGRVVFPAAEEEQADEEALEEGEEEGEVGGEEAKDAVKENETAETDTEELARQFEETAGKEGEEAEETEEAEEAEESEESEELGFDELVEDYEGSATFVPGIPEPLNPVSGMVPLNRANQPTYRVQLLPSTANPEAPIIELEFAASTSSSKLNLVLQRANAIISTQEKQVLLPETIFDVAFSRSLHYDLLEGQDAVKLEQQAASNGEDATPTVSNIIKLTQAFNKSFDPYSTAALPSTTAITLPSAISPDESGTPLTYILPTPTLLRSSRLNRYIYRDLEVNYQSTRDGPFNPAITQSISLTLNRYDDTPAPAWPLATDVKEGESEEMPDGLEGHFRPLHMAAVRLAFGIAAARFGLTGTSGRRTVRTRRRSAATYDPDDVD